MAADVESVALVLVGSADAADESRVGFEHDARVAVLGQLVRAGQAGWTAAGDHGLKGRDDRFRIGLLDARPAMGDDGRREVGECGDSVPICGSSSSS